MLKYKARREESSEEFDRANMVELSLGGERKVDQLVTDCRKAKKFVMGRLKISLSGLLPVSLEEDILDNILGFLNPLDNDAILAWKSVETSEAEKTILASIYRHLFEIYSWIRRGLYTFSYIEVEEVRQDCHDNKMRPLLRDQLQRILAEIKEGEEGGDQ